MGSDFSRNTPHSLAVQGNAQIVHDLSEKTPRTALYLRHAQTEGQELANLLTGYSLEQLLGLFERECGSLLIGEEEERSVPIGVERARIDDFIKRFRDDFEARPQIAPPQIVPQHPMEESSQMSSQTANKKYHKLAEQLENEIALLHKNGLNEQARMISARKDDLILPFLCNPSSPDVKKLKSQRTQLQKKVWGVAEAILTLNGEVARVSLSEQVDGKVISNDNMARIGAEIERALPLRGRGVRSNRHSSSSSMGSSSASIPGTYTPGAGAGDGMLPSAMLDLNSHLASEAGVTGDISRNLELQSDWAATAPGRCPGSHLLLGSGNRFTPKANVSPADITRFIVVRVNKKTLHGFKLRAKREALDGVSKYFLQIQMNFSGPLPDDAVQALHRVLKVCNGHDVPPEGQGIYYSAGVGPDRDDPGVDLDGPPDVVEYMSVHPGVHHMDHLDGPEVKKQRISEGLEH